MSRGVELFFTPARRCLAGHCWNVGNDVHLRILDLDGSVTAQATLHDVVPWSSVATVALRDLAARLRLWSRAATMRLARERIAAQMPADGVTLTLIGSGDFHHLAVPLIAQAPCAKASSPLTVVHFDNHPDWVRWAPRWHCGSWVNQALRLPHVAKVVTLGPCSDDLVRPGLKGGNLRALGEGRIALFPWQHAPSRVFRAIADGAGHRCVDGHIAWYNLAESDPAINLKRILASIETDTIWLTIDKDVLGEGEALTNWDQGRMPLRAMLDLIRAIGAYKRIVGADICGEFSEPVMSNPFKRIESRLDRPRRSADAGALARNESVNRELLRTIHGACAC